MCSKTDVSQVNPDNLGRRVEFSAADEPLRADVELLGKMLGELLAEQGGKGLFDKVEAARKASIQRRESGLPLAAVRKTLSGLDPVAAHEIVRSFSAFFSLTNLAEQIHRIRRRRDYLMDPSEPQPGSLPAVIKTLTDRGLEFEQIRALLDRIEIVPVFTAHPTQAIRRTILAKEQNIAKALVERLQQPLPTLMEERRALERIRTQVTLMWQTEEQPSQRPTVAEEVESVLFYLSDVIYRVVPAFYQAIREALEAGWGEGAADDLQGPRLRFATWVGGDMDGNPNVNADTVRNTLARHRELIIDRYRAEVKRLYDHLSHGTSRVAVSQDVIARIDAYRHDMPEVAARIPVRSEDMPYRVLLWLIWERLGSTKADAAHAYGNADALTADLELISASLLVNSGANGGLALVLRLLERIRTFGFHLATLDLRQDALVHRQACAELLGDPEFVELAATDRAARLTTALDQPDVPLPENPSPSLSATIDVFNAVRECRERFGDEAVGPFIISMAQGADDVLAVLVLARAAGLREPTGEVPIDVAPLFETVDDLNRAQATFSTMLSHPKYHGHLVQRGHRQVVMLGYSDSAKISGIGASRWALYRTQEELVEVANAADVDLTLFHGRGGTVGRGGSKPREGILATPCGAVQGRLRVTEQGEIIGNKYGLRGIAERTLEVTAGAVAEATALCNLTSLPEQSWRQVMDTMAVASRSAYEALVNDPEDFVPYFRAATPIDVIERMAIGSRPPSRRSGSGVESLRAIPWVFAWTQSRHLIPGWLGVGAGLEAARQEHGRKTLVEMARTWPFFATLLGDVSMVLAKADMDIAEAYAELAGEVGLRMFPRIRAAYEQTHAIVLDLRDESTLLEREPVLQRSIRLRNPYVDPMSLVQVDLLRRWRACDRSDAALEHALFDTVRGIARGLRNTG